MTGLSGSNLVGRGRDLEALVGYLDETVAGRGRVVVVSGEAGMGKTRLCEELASVAGSRGVGLAWTACSETGELPALWPVKQLLAQLGTSPPVPVDESAHHDPVAARVEWFQGVVDALRRAGDSAPRLVVLDDVQWADEATLRLLAFGAPILRTMPVQLLLTRRDEQVPPARRPLLRELDRHARLVPLSGLAVDQVGELVEAATGRRVGPAVVRALHRGTGGNPLFVREVAALLARQGRLESLADHDVLPVTSTISAIQAGPLSAVDDHGRQLLGVAAVVGEDWASDLVAEAAVAADNDMAAAVDQALSAGVIRPTAPGSFCFAHPLMRSILQEELGSAKRAYVHGLIATALDRRRREGRAVDPATIAYH